MFNQLNAQSLISGGLANYFVSCPDDSSTWSTGFYPIGHDSAISGSYHQVQGDGGIGFIGSTISIASYYQNAIACQSNGNVLAWGANQFGQLGDSSNVSRQEPGYVSGPTGVGVFSNGKQVDVGLYHSIILRDDSTVWTMGQNSYGQLGDNTANIWNYPVQVVGNNGVGYLSGIVQIAAGSYHNLALKNDGSVVYWGTCTGCGSSPHYPIQKSGLPNNIVAISVDGDVNLALSEDGTIWSWGENQYGQLGNNNWVASQIPVHVIDSAGTGYLSNIKQVVAGVKHCLAVDSVGKVYAWGRNFYNQLGDNTTINRYIPIRVLGVLGIGYLEDVDEIASCLESSAARKFDGQIIAWGWNDAKQLGDGTDINRPYPVLSGLSCSRGESNTGNTNSIAKINEVQNLIIYPNPTIDYLYINYNELSHLEYVEIRDLTGKRVFYKENFECNTRISTTQMSNGIYLISAKTTEGIKTVKLVIN